jgi:hypothetical protein
LEPNAEWQITIADDKREHPRPALSAIAKPANGKAGVGAFTGALA